MRVLAVLWMVFLVGLCHCGGDDSLRKEMVDVSLDLLNPDLGSVHVRGDDKDGLAKRVFTPKDGFAMTKVVIRGDLIWKAKKAGEKCTLVESYSKGDSILVYLKVDTATGLDLKYLERVNGKWKDVTTTEFYQKVGGMREKKEEHEQLLDALKKQYKYATPSTLDLSNPDTSKFDVHTETESGASFKTVTPKDTSLDTSKITTVVDGEKEVWKGVDKEHALSVLVYYAKGDSSLITIGISKGSGSKLDFKHFEKVGGEWVSIDKEDYDQKLKDLKSGVTNPTTLPS
ncbi:signal peptide containing protein [Theileria equi strain WA]|uniref:Signal peptide containing protein n=1 Tax=Theileria equi strain WA TaxID=1537102 RepID=L1LBC7_THEEQ|nr:signal peptide containing protein [Theileria equi strain WA]EKX72468.1 signal peptide containing protein [Theileria equi strain WA]|eukprot:XP_004831920.1 signal peptide containing protein [Theileria equi strain WA]